MNDQKKQPDGHSEFHSRNAFCGNAGPEEMRHLVRMTDVLTDEEFNKLVKAVGISFGMDAVDRMSLEGVIDEADREDFYREYYKLLDVRT